MECFGICALVKVNEKVNGVNILLSDCSFKNYILTSYVQQTPHFTTHTNINYSFIRNGQSSKRFGPLA